MLSSKDYSKMTLEELVSEERKMKTQQIPTALLAGFLVGIMIWSATHKGGATTFILMFVVFWIAGKTSQNTKNLKEEISRRNNVC